MSRPDLIELTATQAAADIARGVISAEDYTGACLERIAAIEGEVQAFAHLDPEHALAQARALDRHKSEGRLIGPLHGIPVGIKDIFDTADYPTECGSPIFAGRRPAADATAVRKLREAGAVIIGKTVSTEFAYFHPGKTRNPRDLKRTPGGSSSGSAAAVAAGMVPLAIGSQTNGSMIRPAAFCGVFGIKPSHGLISRAGALTLSGVLDHVGTFARSIEDLALILDVLVGQDPADPDSRPYASPSFRASAAEAPPIPPSFALVRTPMWEKADADTRSAIEDLAKELGAREVDLPDDYRAAWEAQRIIMATDMAVLRKEARQTLSACSRLRRACAVAFERTLRWNSLGNRNRHVCAESPSRCGSLSSRGRWLDSPPSSAASERTVGGWCRGRSCRGARGHGAARYGVTILIRAPRSPAQMKSASEKWHSHPRCGFLYLMGGDRHSDRQNTTTPLRSRRASPSFWTSSGSRRRILPAAARPI